MSGADSSVLHLDCGRPRGMALIARDHRERERCCAMRALELAATHQALENLRVRAEVEPVAPGSLVPASVLEDRGLKSKPRYLVEEEEEEEEEELSDALLYYS